MKECCITFIYVPGALAQRMDATSLYLRLFLGARPFKSSELDGLAGRMGVTGLLSQDSNDRYFSTGIKVSAARLGNKILFGKRYYASLDSEQRLAVTAHEFAHMLDGRDSRMRLVILALAMSSICMVGAYLGTHSSLLTESAFVAGFVGTTSISSWVTAGASRELESRCDKVAAQFVGGEPLIASIRLAESMNRGLSKRHLRIKSASGHPPFEERVDAIRGFIASRLNGMPS